MRIAITGATGFLGGRLAVRLATRGNRVIAFGRDRTRGAALTQPNIDFLPFDLAEGALPSPLPAADVVVHAAALSSAWGPERHFRLANVHGTEKAIGLARMMGARRFIFISSPAVTFRMADCPAIAENDPLPPPVNAYAKSKAVAEELVRAAGDLRPVILRPRAIYGRGEKSLLPRLIRAAEAGPLPLLRGGQAMTQLTHVEDVVDAILASFHAPEMASGRTYHVAGPEILPVRFIAEEACRRSGVDARWRGIPWPLARMGVQLIESAARLRGASEPRITLYGLGLFAYTQVLDTTAIERDLGFVPRIGLTDGLDETFAGGRA